MLGNSAKTEVPFAGVYAEDKPDESHQPYLLLEERELIRQRGVRAEGLAVLLGELFPALQAALVEDNQRLVEPVVLGLVQDVDQLVLEL